MDLIAANALTNKTVCARYKKVLASRQAEAKWRLKGAQGKYKEAWT